MLSMHFSIDRRKLGGTGRFFNLRLLKYLRIAID